MANGTNNLFGLKRYHNSCYINSAIQILYHCVPIRNLIFQVNADHEQPIYALQGIFYKMQAYKDAEKKQEISTHPF